MLKNSVEMLIGFERKCSVSAMVNSPKSVNCQTHILLCLFHGGLPILELSMLGMRSMTYLYAGTKEVVTEVTL